MVPVRSFTSRGHAEVAASMLRAHGIPAHVTADDAAGTAPHLRLGSGGILLHVDGADVGQAAELLDHDPGGDSEPTLAPARRARLLLLGRGVAALVLVTAIWQVLGGLVRSLG